FRITFPLPRNRDRRLLRRFLQESFFKGLFSKRAAIPWWRMRFDPRRAVVRTVLATTLGFSVGVVLIARGASPAIAVLAGIVTGGALLLGLIWSLLSIAGGDETQRRAWRDDPGRRAVFLLMLSVSAIALLAATILVRTERQAPPQGRALLVALCLA